MKKSSTLLPVVGRLEEAKDRSPAALLFLCNGILLLLAGAFCYIFPESIEGVHTHRKGEEEIIESIRVGSLLLGGIGLLYTLVGGLNQQGYIYGLLLHRFTAIPLLYLCYHFGRIYWVEYLAYIVTDPLFAAITYWLHRKHTIAILDKHR